LAGERHSIQKNLKAASLNKEIENSLRRLQTDTVDLYQIHWPTEDIEEGWQALVDAQRAGKIRCIGVSNHNVAQMKALQK
jgi:aryl-alcohol dehydrogenase-like predicted oxidoreductase